MWLHTKRALTPVSPHTRTKFAANKNFKRNNVNAEKKTNNSRQKDGIARQMITWSE